MITIDAITAFLGWCSVINIGVLLLTTILLIILKDPIVNIHSKLFGLSRDDLPLIYFQYIANYKIAIIIFNLVPYIAMKLMN